VAIDAVSAAEVASPFVLAPVTGVILAGGQGRRMGGVDKGWVPWRGRPLVAWAIERLAPQVDQLLIVANRSQSDYAALGYPVVSDPEPWGFAGPLAGVVAALTAAPTEWIVTVPCDSPLLPGDLVARFRAALAGADGLCGALLPVLVAHDGARTHPVFLAVHRRHLAGLTDFLTSGRRRIDAWYGTLPHLLVSFADEPDAFANGNTPDELAALAERNAAPLSSRLLSDASGVASGPSG